jgi:hypothetical protein
MSNPTANPYRISLTEMPKQEGRSFEAMAEAVMFGDANALALCTEHCEVEPDGTCPHGCPRSCELQASSSADPHHRTIRPEGEKPDELYRYLFPRRQQTPSLLHNPPRQRDMLA